MRLPPFLTTITPFSKGAFLALLIALPFWGFFLGIQYMDAVTQESILESKIVPPSPKQDKAAAETSAIRTKLDSCIADLRQKTEDDKVTYEKGSILVSFASSTSYTAAQKIIATYALTAATSSVSAASFKTSHTLTVPVATDDEFRWSCILGEDSNVVFAGVNPTFDLHE